MPEKVKVTIPTDLLVEKTIEIPIVGTDFPPNKRLRTFPSKVTVRFLIAFHRFRNVDEDDFFLEVPYKDIASFYEKPPTGPVSPITGPGR